MKFWCLDPKTGKPSVTLSLMVLGFCVATFKLLVSSVSINGIAFETFSGADFAMVVGALGALYGYRKTVDNRADALVESDAVKAATRLERENKPPMEGPGE